MSHLANGWSVGRWSALLHDTDRTVRPAWARHVASHHERTYSLLLRGLNAAHSKMGLRRPRLTPASPPPGESARRHRQARTVREALATLASSARAVASRRGSSWPAQAPCSAKRSARSVATDTCL